MKYHHRILIKGEGDRLREEKTRDLGPGLAVLVVLLDLLADKLEEVIHSDVGRDLPIKKDDQKSD